MSVQLCPTCGRRPSERFGRCSDCEGTGSPSAESHGWAACGPCQGNGLRSCDDPIHDFADTHAAEVARLTAELESSEANASMLWEKATYADLEVARLTAELEESRKLHADALRLVDACSDWAFQRNRHNEEVARLRGALEAADVVLEKVARIYVNNADDVRLTVAASVARGAIKAALAPAARKEDERG